MIVVLPYAYTSLKGGKQALGDRACLLSVVRAREMMSTLVIPFINSIKTGLVGLLRRSNRVARVIIIFVQNETGIEDEILRDLLSRGGNNRREAEGK